MPYEKCKLKSYNGGICEMLEKNQHKISRDVFNKDVKLINSIMVQTENIAELSYNLDLCP